MRDSRKLILIFAALLVSLFPSPLGAVDEVFYSGNDILFYSADTSCSSNTETNTITSTGGTKGKISIVQANIKQHIEDVGFITKDKPDFVTLNESGYHTIPEIEVPGYKGYRDNSFFKTNAATRQAKSTSVLWNEERWSKVDAGREIIVPTQGPQEWDMGRAITWVVLRDSDGGTTSVISLHHMINVNKYPGSPQPDKPLRKQLYGEAMDKVASKVKELSVLGPVLIGGDFNYQISDDDDYGPRKKLATVNMESTHDSLGRLDGVSIDYVFYTKNMVAEKHSMVPKNSGENHSDHPYLYATFTADGSGGGSSDVSSEAVCTCSASTSSLTLAGSNNEERAFGFFTGKGLSPQQAAGVVGNMKAESGVLPMRLQNTTAETETSSRKINLNGLGWGIVQWTPPSKMVNPSLNKGKTYEEIDSLAYQLEFLWGQLTGTGIGAATSEKAAGDDLKTQTTIDGSARSFMLKFERPKDQSESAQKGRVQLANEVFGKYGSSDIAGEAPTLTGATVADCSSGGGSGDVVQIAQAELAKGVKEDPLGCDSGNPSTPGSCGPNVDKYTDSTLEYWCADFVSWVYKEAGKPFTGGSSGGWRIAAVSSVQAWFEEHATYTKNGPDVIPKPGDVYIMGISHTGIVEKVEGNKIYTISGNTSTDSTGNGNGVGRGTYTVGSTDIEGYGRL